MFHGHGLDTDFTALRQTIILVVVAVLGLGDGAVSVLKITNKTSVISSSYKRKNRHSVRTESISG